LLKMNTGIISVRYARALQKSAALNGDTENVFSDMKNLAANFLALPGLGKAMDNPTIAKADKEQLLVTACGGNPCNQTRSFLKLVLKEGRENMVQFMANSYMSLYRSGKNIVPARLITAVPVDESTRSKFNDVVKKRTKADIEFETKVDADIIGGFILEYDTYRLDSSVKTQLRSILKQLK
jgi:F-type H+-transporting ATPase subunit delta